MISIIEIVKRKKRETRKSFPFLKDIMQKSILRVGVWGIRRAASIHGPAGCPARTGTFIIIRRKFDGPPGEAAPTLGSAVLRGFGRGRTLAGPSYVYHRFFVIRCRGRRPRRPTILISGEAATFSRVGVSGIRYTGRPGVRPVRYGVGNAPEIRWGVHSGMLFILLSRRAFRRRCP